MKQIITACFFAFAFLFLIPSESYPQNPESRFLTLDQVISIAREQSPDAMAARHRYRGSYWRHRSYQAGYLPGLRFDATLPNLNRTIQAITLPDGTDVFVRRSLASSSGNLSLNQRVGFTGGQIFMSTDWNA